MPNQPEEAIEKILEILKSATTRKEFHDYCNQVRDSNGGTFPDWWVEKVLVSGLLIEKLKDFEWEESGDFCDEQVREQPIRNFDGEV